MKITKVDIPEDKSLGLKSIKMSQTDKLVLIAGKNGSGKSRILSKIKETLPKKPLESSIKIWKAKQKKEKQELKSAQGRLKELEDAVKRNYTNEHIDKGIRQSRNIIERAKKEIMYLDGKLAWSLIETSELADNYQYVDFVPKNLELIDSYSFTKGQLVDNAVRLDVLGIMSSPASTFAKIQHVQDQWFNATHQNSTTETERKNEIIASYERLCEYIRLFLDTDLARSEDGDAQIFGFRLGQSNLSDGQKVLIQLCLALYTQETKLSDLIIFMDEPENHLHPKALIEVVDKLYNAVSNGQLWIATHSINLLAHYDPKYIWYVENGSIKYSGNLPERVLAGLIGDEEEIEKLSNFLSLPAQMATTKFSFECLFAPLTLNTGKDDPQTKQIIESIHQLKKENKNIRVLDFGAGKGRLLTTIFETTLEDESQVSEWLDYFAYDLPSDDKEECQAIINNVYGSDSNRYFDNQDSLLESVDEKSFDIVVMCNVFHEIPPKDWLSHFNSHGLIKSALSDDGILLVVEDQLIPIGEKAYENGFLVLDKNQFKKLFNCGDYDMLDARGDGRLRAHFIPSNVLQKIDNKSKIAAIKSLQETAKRKIKELRASDKSFKKGKLHGFWTQQLANAQLCLDELELS